MRAIPRAALAALSACLAAAAHAQQARALDPLEAAASAPVPAYESAFDGYRRYQEPKLAPWRETNDALGMSPGHVKAPGDSPAPSGHLGHMQAPGAAQTMPPRDAGNAQPAHAPTYRHAR